MGGAVSSAVNVAYPALVVIVTFLQSYSLKSTC
jgi:hypothetical protein